MNKELIYKLYRRTRSKKLIWEATKDQTTYTSRTSPAYIIACNDELAVFGKLNEMGDMTPDVKEYTKEESDFYIPLKWLYQLVEKNIEIIKLPDIKPRRNE